jgi:dolichyl-phosphate mannosyltransferase polypeptide 3
MHTLSLTHTFTHTQFPLWSLVTFGAYALSNIGLNLITFNNCPTAAQELTQDIQEAKTEMRKRGLKMDY